MNKGLIMQCTYCGHAWKPKARSYGGYYLSDKDYCPKCKDKNVVEKPYEKIDYYADGNKKD